VGGSRETQLPALSRGLLLAPADLSAHASSKRYCTCLCPTQIPKNRIAESERAVVTGQWDSDQASDQPARCEFDVDLRPLPLEAAVLIDFVIARAAPCSLRRTGDSSPGGVGQRWTTERRESDTDASFCRVSAALWRVQRYAKKSRDEGSVTQCRPPRR
jgi:hypothetical protein